MPAALPRIAAGFCFGLCLVACGGGGGGGDSLTVAATGFTASGTILASASNATDSDVNDPNAAYADNDSIANAQPVPNPATIGGYVNQPGSGPAGRSQAGGDPSDLFRITLAANQTLTLSIADGRTADLDLFLGQANGTLLASSESPGSIETLTSPAAGEYIVEVYAFSGASNYTLAIGQQILSLPAASLSSRADFVANEIVARFHGSASASAQQLAAARGARLKAGARGRPVLLGVAGGGTSRVAQAGPRPVLIETNGALHEKWETIRAVKQLRGQAEVEYAEPNYLRRSLLEPNDPHYSLQWHYPMLNLPQAWDITTGSAAVSVAVVDTGILADHPDLQGQLLPGYDFVSDPLRSLDGDGIDPDPADPGGAAIGSVNFHGSHVAGTIAAATNNLTGVAGINWSAGIMPLRALGQSGVGTSYDILQAVRYAAGLPNDSGRLPDRPADIINLSFGGAGYSQLDQDLYTEVRKRGVIVVAAAGNDASSLPGYPASYSGVVSVSAVDITRQPAAYSNYGPFIDIAAPGGSVGTDINGDGTPDAVLSTSGEDTPAGIQPNYRYLQGTSMAAPHVAGVVALMKSVLPGLTPQQFDDLLASGRLTTDLGAPGRDDYYGFGLIDAHMAVVAAQGGSSPVPPTLVASPTALNFGSLATSALLSISNGGGGALLVDAPVTDAAWLRVSADAVDPATGIGTWRVLVARSGLAEGTYTATIRITSSANTLQLPVIMQVSALSLEADSGHHYIQLLDAQTDTVIDQVGASAVNGEYPYTFSNVPAGTYRIVAGTDADNDGYICDPGEACGGYVALGQLTPVDLRTDRRGLDFSSGYDVLLNVAAALDDMPRPVTQRIIKRLAP